MPITSSMIAAETIVVPSFVLILPSSLSTETVIATLVAVSMVPMKILRKMPAVSCTPSPTPPKGIEMTKPRIRGIITPASATKTATSPVDLSSLRFVSRPVENIRSNTPIFENIPSALSFGNASKVKYPSPSKPISEKPQKSPKIAGPTNRPAII